MTDPQPAGKSRPEADKGQAHSGSRLPPDGAGDALPAGQPTASNPLTPEEQMALYEKDLKENDWGHQPC